MNTDDLIGRLFPAVPAILDADGGLDSEGHAAYVSYMSRCDVGGVAVWAHTGRGLKLSEEARGAVLDLWRRGLPDKKIIAAAGAPGGLRRPDEVLAHAKRMAKQAAGQGADALLVHPPAAFRGRADQDRLVLEYHAEIAEAGLPLLLFYLYEAAGGVSYGPAVLAQLLARPEVLGIKVATLDRVMTFQDVAELIQKQAPDKVLITGEDRFLGYSLMCGARSALIGMAAARTKLQARFLKAYWTGDADTFLKLNSLVDDLARHTFVSPMEGYVKRLLWCLEADGVVPESASYDPWGPSLSEGERAAVRSCLERLGPDE